MALGLYVSKFWMRRVDGGAIRVLMIGLALVAATLLAVQTFYDIFTDSDDEIELPQPNLSID